MADYVTDGKIGIDLTAIYASTSAGSSALWPASPGDIVHTNNNGKYMFVRAGSTIAAFDVCVITTLGTSASLSPIPNAVPVDTTNAAALGWPQVCIPQVAITSAYYGWAALEGSKLRANVLIACNPKVPLYTTATSGSLDDTTVSAGYVVGIVLNSSAVSASAMLCIVSNPHLVAHA